MGGFLIALVDRALGDSLFGGAVVEDVAEVAVPVGRADLRPEHPVAPIFTRDDIASPLGHVVSPGRQPGNRFRVLVGTIHDLHLHSPRRPS